MSLANNISLKSLNFDKFITNLTLKTTTLSSTIDPSYSSDESSSSSQSNQNNEPGDSTDMKTYLNFRFILTWLTLLVILVGLVGNLISFVILINPKMRIATNIFLSSLCVSGFLALLGFLINSVIYELVAYYAFMKALTILYFFYPFIYPIITTFQMVSILLTVCVSVNQFVCIYFSRVKSNSQKVKDDECKTALIIVLLMYLISILYCIPYWLKFKYSNGYLVYTEIGQDPLFNKIVHFWMYLPMVYIIPFSILIITNSYLLVRIMMARRKRSKLGLNKKLTLSTATSNTKKSTIANNSKIKLKSLDENGDEQHHQHQGESVEMIKRQQITSHTPVNALQKVNNPKIKTGGMNITIMLIAVVFFFFICQFPSLVIHIIQSMICNNEQLVNECDRSMFYKYSLVICKFLLICNLSFNFAFYCLFSEKFRQVFKETFKQNKSK